jgi:hypothetical protein
MTREQFVNLVASTQKAFRRFLLALCCGDAALANDIAQHLHRGRILPLLDRWLMALSASLSRLQPEALTIDLHIGVWVLMAGACGITALNAYDIALIKLTPKRDAPSRA